MENFNDNPVVHFTNEGNFSFLVIKPNNIDHLDYNKEGYINEVIKCINLEEIICDKDNFFFKVGDHLQNDKYGSDDSQILKNIVHEEENYLYEILYLDIKKNNLLKADIFNGLGTLMNIENNHLWGNVILTKTYLPFNDLEKNEFSTVNKNDIFNILDSRVNTKIVYYEDGEFREEKIYGDIDHHSKRFFGDEFVNRNEIGFLAHNLNIYYTTSEIGEKFIPNIVKSSIDNAIFFTMKNDEFRGNLTLKELEKIIRLSNKLEKFSVDSELIKDEFDTNGKKIIKNKYRLLELSYNNLFQNELKN